MGSDNAVIHCFAGCDPRDVVAALGMSLGDLFAANVPHSRSSGSGYPTQTSDLRQPTPNDRGRYQRGDVTATYDYVWPDSEPCARVLKYREVEAEGGAAVKKTFRQQRWDAEGREYVWGLAGLEVPLYHADEVARAVREEQLIVICEGEKDADAAATVWGVVATTNPMGAGSWRSHHTDALKGAFVVVIADDDDAGRRHAAYVVQALEGVAAEVELMLPTRGSDVADHIEAGGTWEELRPLAVNADVNDGCSEIRQTFPALDWRELWAEPVAQEWILEPLLPARRLVSIYSEPKLGKSLLILEVAVHLSRGDTSLGFAVKRPYRVLYIDYENDPRADIRSRLQAMGYGPDDLSNLFYLSFPAFGSMDSAEGGQQLLEAVAAYGAEVVVIDTVSRAIQGKENENDTWLSFYRHTGLLLKKAGVTMLRLDHSGKDQSKGQRGGSAKSGDVDAVWRLARKGTETLSLRCEAARFFLDEESKELLLRRVSEPQLRHEVLRRGRSVAAGVPAVVTWLDEQGLADDLTVKQAAERLRAGGRQASQAVIAAACRERRDRRREK